MSAAGHGLTPELFWLLMTAILAALLWVPFIVLSSRPADAPFQSFARMARISEMSDITQRAYRAHLNLLEQFLPFAVVVLIAHLAGVSNGLTLAACAAFFWLRIAHAVGFIAGFARMPLRPLLFTGGWVCILAIAAAILLA